MAEGYRYTVEHEWAKLEGEEVRVGISDYAQQELGDVVFVELPKVGKSVKQGDVLLTVESVKAVSEVYAPFSGTITAVNEALSKTPELINITPEGAGWLLVLQPGNVADLQKLMTFDDYQKFVAEIAH